MNVIVQPYQTASFHTDTLSCERIDVYMTLYNFVDLSISLVLACIHVADTTIFTGIIFGAYCAFL